MSRKEIRDAIQSIKRREAESVQLSRKPQNGCGISDGEDISKVIWDYAMSLAPEKRLSASWTLNEIFHSEATRLGEYVHQRLPGWDWGKPFDTNILDGYQQGVDMQA